MKFRMQLKVLASIGAVISANPALSQVANTYATLNGPQVAAFLRNKGYQGELSADTVGDPLIHSSVGGTKFLIFFSGCDKSAVRSCTIMQFRSTFANDKNYAPADMNRCNSMRFGGRAWLADDNSVNVDLTLPVAHISDAYLENTLDIWSAINSGYQTCLTDQRK